MRDERPPNSLTAQSPSPACDMWSESAPHVSHLLTRAALEAHFGQLDVRERLTRRSRTNITTGSIQPPESWQELRTVSGGEQPPRLFFFDALPSRHGNTIASSVLLEAGARSSSRVAGREVQRTRCRRRRAVPAAVAALVCLPRAVLRPMSAGDDGKHGYVGKTEDEVDALAQEPAMRQRCHPAGTRAHRRRKQSRPKVASPHLR